VAAPHVRRVIVLLFHFHLALCNNTPGIARIVIYYCSHCLYRHHYTSFPYVARAPLIFVSFLYSAFVTPIRTHVWEISHKYANCDAGFVFRLRMDALRFYSYPIMDYPELVYPRCELRSQKRFEIFFKLQGVRTTAELPYPSEADHERGSLAAHRWTVVQIIQ
jgi:hypothetical protein